MTKTCVNNNFVSFKSAEYETLRNSQLPWIEKYRPKKIDYMILNDNLKNIALQCIKTKNLPNMILTGEPGIGKTSTIRCIAYGLYGENYNDNVLELNASDDRGIKSVQGDIINFCNTIKSKKKSINDEQTNTQCMHKLVILDEADNIMDKAQHQINSLMEQYKNTVRFALTSNSSADIIEAIQSKCAILRYSKLTSQQVADRLKTICEIEKITYEKNALLELAQISKGDMRNAINMLQLLYNKHDAIKQQNIQDISCMPQSVTIKEIFKCCNENNLKKAISLVLDLKHDGYSGSDITLGMIHTLKTESCEITDKLKIKMMYEICNSAYNISRGTDTNLQLIACLALLTKINV